MIAKTKLVNGKRVDLTSEESAAIEAEWKANRAKPEPPLPRDLEQEVDELKKRIITLETTTPER